MLLKASTVAAYSLLVFALFALFSASLTLFKGVYNVVDQVLGIGDGVCCVYNEKATTPVTGLIKLSRINVSTYSAEILVPATVNGTSTIVRGVDFRNLTMIERFEVVSGEMVRKRGAAVVGYKFAQELNVDVGDNLVIVSAIGKRYVVVRVSAVIKSGTHLDYEVLISLDDARVLRGVGKGVYTIVRYKCVNGQHVEPTFLERLGVPLGVFYAFPLVSCGIAMYATYMCVKALIVSNEDVLYGLYVAGIGRRRVIAYVLKDTLPALAAAVFGALIGSYLVGCAQVKILLYKLPQSTPPFVEAASLYVLASTASVIQEVSRVFRAFEGCDS